MSGGFQEEEGFRTEPDEIESDQAQRSRKSAGLVILIGMVTLGVLTYFGIAQGMAALVVFPGIPLVLAWFAYWFFLRRLIRMRAIRKAEERRLLREAAQRGREQ